MSRGVFDLTPPRGLTIADAAARAGVSCANCDAVYLRGDNPQPTSFGRRFDRRLLERCMDQLSNIRFPSDPQDRLAG